MPFVQHNTGAVSFILELPLRACLVDGVFPIAFDKKGIAIHSFPSHTYTCSYVLYNCLSYKLIREVVKSNF